MLSLAMAFAVLCDEGVSH